MKPLRQLQDNLDMKKRFPNYFNVWIFRGFILVIVLLVFGAFVLEGFNVEQLHTKHIYLECPSGVEYCRNPFYVCGTDATTYTTSFSEKIELKIPIEYTEDMCAEFVDEWICEKVPCDRKYLRGGETFGKKPTFLVAQFPNIVMMLLVLTFLINHIYFKMRGAGR